MGRQREILFYGLKNAAGRERSGIAKTAGKPVGERWFALGVANGLVAGDVR